MESVKSVIKIGGKEYKFFSIKKAGEIFGFNPNKLPNSTKVLLESLLRKFDGDVIAESHIKYLIQKNTEEEISFYPARVLMQDFTGVPAVVDLAAMRDELKKSGHDPKIINPLIPVDLVIDHSVQVDKAGNADAFGENIKFEMERNYERYKFLKWGKANLNNFSLVTPGNGICHQINIEYLAKVVFEKDGVLYNDSVVGTDSHTTMVNGLSVLGWGVGGIEAEAAMLGQPISMTIPEVVGVKLYGNLDKSVNATDLVLHITSILRKFGVVGKFVEFFGPALSDLTLADRATIANMAPEYGATCGFFPIDNETIKYLKLTGRKDESCEIVELYAKEQGFWSNSEIEPEFSAIIDVNLSEIETFIAGPKLPQSKVKISELRANFSKEVMGIDLKVNYANPLLQNDPRSYADEERNQVRTKEDEAKMGLQDGSVVIAAITSCTNTSNPYVMIAAGLVAKKADDLGIKIPDFVKTSLAPGSKVVTEYLTVSGLQKHLDKIGFNLVGYGCTTCIGNSGPLDDKIESEIKTRNLSVAAVLSGNRNFEGRVHPLTKANYLASPPLVVIYAIAGTVNIDITKDEIAKDKNGESVYLKDLYPNRSEIQSYLDRFVTKSVFSSKYNTVFEGEESWSKIESVQSDTYHWDLNSTYIRKPTFFENHSSGNIKNARILLLLGDSITTDHISPAGDIALDSPAAEYLRKRGVDENDFNSYGARRGNHEVMMRGTFSNIRIKNQMLDGKIGGYSKHFPSDEIGSVFDISMKYQSESTPLIIFAGKEYGTGSSRDWAAKGTRLLGVKAVIAKSFERIHRSNLIGMGVMPLIYDGDLALKGDEIVDILDIENIKPRQKVRAIVKYSDGSSKNLELLVRIDTSNELEYYRNGGIMQYMVNKVRKPSS